MSLHKIKTRRPFHRGNGGVVRISRSAAAACKIDFPAESTRPWLAPLQKHIECRRGELCWLTVRVGAADCASSECKYNAVGMKRCHRRKTVFDASSAWNWFIILHRQSAFQVYTYKLHTCCVATLSARRMRVPRICWLFRILISF